MKIKYVDVSLELNINGNLTVCHAQIIENNFNSIKIEGKDVIKSNIEDMLKDLLKCIQKKGYEF